MWIKKDYLMDELEKAHNDYIDRKERLLVNLITMKSNLDGDNYVPKNYVYWLEQAIEFIKEKEV